MADQAEDLKKMMKAGRQERDRLQNNTHHVQSSTGGDRKQGGGNAYPKDTNSDPRQAHKGAGDTSTPSGTRPSSSGPVGGSGGGGISPPGKTHTANTSFQPGGHLKTAGAHHPARQINTGGYQGGAHGSPAASRAERGSEAASSSTRIITVTSGKGGVGKTNIATNLAIGFAKEGKRVVLMDADLGLANVNVILGIIPKYNLYHLVRRQRTLEDIIMKTEYGIEIIAGASGFAKVANLNHDEREAFISAMVKLADIDIIVIDTGAGVSHNVLSFVAAGHESIIVTTPEPTAITDAYGIIKIIATEFPSLPAPPKIIVNRVKSAVEANRVSRRIVDISNQFLNTKIDYLGYVYEDEIVHQAVLRQKPFSVLNPRAKASQCISHLVSRICSNPVNPHDGDEKGLGGFFSRLFSSSKS